MKVDAFARALAVACVLGLPLAGCGSPFSFDAAGANGKVGSVNGTSVAAAVSQYRASRGLGPVVVDSNLTKMAEHQAKAVARAGTLSHSVDGEFKTRLASFGVGPGYAAENLSAGQGSASETLTRWKNSPDHNANLLLAPARRIGIAKVDAPGSRYGSYWAMVLAQ